MPDKNEVDKTETKNADGEVIETSETRTEEEQPSVMDIIVGDTEKSDSDEKED